MEEKTLQVGKRKFTRLKSFPLAKKDEKVYGELGFVVPLNMASKDSKVGKKLSGAGGDAEKSNEHGRLPNIENPDDKLTEFLRNRGSSSPDRRPSPRHKSHSTNIPPLPSLYKHDTAVKYPLASKYFNKWQHSHKGASSGMLTDIKIIDEEGNGNDYSEPQRAPLHISTRFPSSPEFNAVLRSIFEKDKTNEE